MSNWTNTLAAILSIAGVSSSAAQTCQPYWQVADPYANGNYGVNIALASGKNAGLYATRTLPHTPMSVGRWDGHTWQHIALPSDTPAPVEIQLPLLKLDDGTGEALYLKGRYLFNSQYTYRMWRWTGSAWNPCPPPMYDFTETTYAAPHFSYNPGTGPFIFGQLNCGFGAWSGTSWQIVSDCINFNSGAGKGALGVGDFGTGPKVIFICNFGSIGTDTNLREAVTWDGQHWQRLGTNLRCFEAFDMAIFDRGNGPELYVAGSMKVDGGAPVNLVRWTGVTWEAMPDVPIVNSLATFDDGAGPALYAAGNFGAIGGILARGIAKYDGTQWHALGAGIGALYRSDLIEYDDGSGPSLFVSASLGAEVGGGLQGPGPMQWVGCPNCYANCDGSTNKPRLTANDFMCFLNRYVMRDPYANCTVDGTINIADFQCFIAKYAEGCR